MSRKVHTVETETPDLPPHLDHENIAALYDRQTFRVNARTFTRTEPGEYTDGKIVVYCDQQDSTAWAASVGDLSTSYYWTPEFAVQYLLVSLEAAK